MSKLDIPNKEAENTGNAPTNLDKQANLDNSATCNECCTQELQEGIDSDFSHPADLAEHLENLSFEEQICLLKSLPVEEAAEAVAELEEFVRVNILEALDDETASKILAQMSPDDAADVLDELEKDHQNVLLNNLDIEDAEEIRHLMAFDPDTAGGIMNTEIIILEEDLSVDEAIQTMRNEIEDKEIPYYGYIVDAGDRLVGVISLRDLLLSKPGTRLKEKIEEQDLITVTFDVGKQEVARLLSHYNFMAMPVVDKEERLLGVITHDDVIDVINELASEDLLGMVGAGVDETVDTPWTNSIRVRLPWLLLNMFTSSLSAYVVYLFDGTIAQMALLAVLMPMVANQAGNTGQQALAVMIRELATTRFEAKRAWNAVLREGKIGLTSGVLLGFLVSIAVWLVFDNQKLGIIMGCALVLDMVLGSLAGASIPLILKSLGRDPAQASSIFLTTITDGAGFFIFLGLATIFLF